MRSLEGGAHPAPFIPAGADKALEMEKRRQDKTTTLSPPQREEHSPNRVSNKHQENVGITEETGHVSKSNT